MDLRHLCELYSFHFQIFCLLFNYQSHRLYDVDDHDATEL